MQDSGEESLKNTEVSPKEQTHTEDEFFEDGNVEFDGEFEEGSEFRFSPGFRYVFSIHRFLRIRIVTSITKFIS